MSSSFLTISTLHKLKYGKNINNNELQNIILKMIGKTEVERQSIIFKKYEMSFEKKGCIDFLTIVKDGEFYYRNVFPNIYKNICKNMNARFFIYENNSIDNTKQILNELQEKHDNIIIKTEDIVNFSGSRFDKISGARNSLSCFYKEYLLKNPSGSNFVFLFDTDIIFNYEITIEPLLKTVNFRSEFMILPFSVYAGYNPFIVNILSKKTPISHYDNMYLKIMLNYYYDTLALNDGKYYLKNTRKFFDSNNEVETGFGGLGLIRRDYYLTTFYNVEKIKDVDNIKLEDNICEHWGFCHRLRHFSQIIITKKAQALWYQSRDYYNDVFFNYVRFFIEKKKLGNILK